MKNKEWYENIPEQGVLCKSKDNFILNIIDYEIDDFLVICDRHEAYPIEYITPTTPQEWFAFAPWNYDMNSAPKDGTLILLKNSYNYVDIAYSYLRGWATTGDDYFNNPIAWLPLQDQIK